MAGLIAALAPTIASLLPGAVSSIGNIVGNLVGKKGLGESIVKGISPIIKVAEDEFSVRSKDEDDERKRRQHELDEKLHEIELRKLERLAGPPTSASRLLPVSIGPGIARHLPISSGIRRDLTTPRRDVRGRGELDVEELGGEDAGDMMDEELDEELMARGYEKPRRKMMHRRKKDKKDKKKKKKRR
jgi:hypothetical protein